MVNWGIIGLGNIAGRFAESLSHEPNSILAAVSSRSQEKADAFAAKFGAQKSYAGHENLLADEKIQAVYLALPHALHKDFAIRALKAGKAVLCEKPATLNAAEMSEIAAVARAEKVLFMEAMKPRFVPLYKKLNALLDEGIIGKITGVATSLCNEMNLTGKTYHSQPGQGGALLDVGIYCASWLQDFLKVPPALKKVEADVRGGVDYYVNAELDFGGKFGRLECAFDRQKPRQATIFGEKGRLVLSELHRPRNLTIITADNKFALIEVQYKVDDFFGEIEHFVSCVENGAAESEIMSLNDSIACAKILDVIRGGF